MKLSLFDLHCDTAGEMLRQGQPLDCNSLAVSLQKAAVFSEYVQVMAHWTPFPLKDEEGWEHYLRMTENLRRDPALEQGKARIVTSFPTSGTGASLFLAIEDVRILAGKQERVDTLYQNGIRIITPLWKGSTIIGGSHDTEEGLTAFGKASMKRAVELGIVLDISHASVQSANDVFEISAEVHRPVIASHSNAYDVCSVSRNLRREQVQAIVASNGLIGLNLYKGFLTLDKTATAEDALRHIDYFLTLGAKDHLALGCDMDGCDLPPDIPNLSALPHLAELMQAHGYPEELIHAIFYGNAARFAKIYLCK